MQPRNLSTEMQKRTRGHVRVTLALTVIVMVALLVGSPGAMSTPVAAAAPPTPSTIPTLPTLPTHRVASRANGQPPAFNIPGVKPAAVATAAAALTPFTGPADGHTTPAGPRRSSRAGAAAVPVPPSPSSRLAPRLTQALFIGSLKDDSTGGACTVSTNTDCTLREAIRIANGDTGDTISPAAGVNSFSTTTLTTGALEIARNMTINGGRLLAVDGNHNDTVFVVDVGVAATLNELIIVNGMISGAPGGGIYNAGTLSVVTCVIALRTANGSDGSGGGGGIFNDGGTLSIVNSTLGLNQTDYSGGGIGNDAGGVVTLINSTLFVNLAAANGGGIENFNNKGPDGNGAVVRVIASTITSNFAGDQGGGIRNAATNATLSLGRNAIGRNANNFSIGPPLAAPRIQPACVCGYIGDDVSNDHAPALTDTGYNVVSVGDGAAGLANGVNGSLTGTAALPLDLLLATVNVAFSGVFAPLPGSPAIERVPLTGGAGSGCAITYTDAATGTTRTLNTDQRGVTRPQPLGGICDAGSFESGGFDLTKSGDGQNTLPGTTFPNPLGIGITPKTAGDPVDGGFITFVITPNPTTGAAALFAPSDPNCDISANQLTADCPVIHDMTGDHATTPLLTASALGGDFTVIASLYGAFPVTFTLTNIRVATTTVVTSNSNPTTYGQPTALNASVTGAGGTPTGSVTFYNGTTALGTLPLVGGVTPGLGLITSVLPVGMDTITADYTGDTVFAPSTSAPVTQTVTKATPTLHVTTAPNPSAFGQAVTLTAQVGGSPASGPPPPATAPTGTVTFTSGMTTLGTGTLAPSLTVISGSVATATTSTLPVGSNAITAQYAGDSNYLPTSGVGERQLVQGTLVISPATLPAGIVTVAYSQSLTASGGQLPYTFTLLSGTLPPGIALTGLPVMPAISGTPTTVGVYSFTIKVTDSTAATTQTQYTLTIGAASVTQIVTTAPSGSGSGNGGNSGTPNAPVIRTLGTVSLGTVGSYNDGTHGGLTNLTYTGYDPKIISVSASGVVTGIAGGTTTITITAPNGVTTTITITVSAGGGSGLMTPAPQPMAKAAGATVVPGASVVVQPNRR